MRDGILTKNGMQGCIVKVGMSISGFVVYAGCKKLGVGLKTRLRKGSSSSEMNQIKSACAVNVAFFVFI